MQGWLDTVLRRNSFKKVDKIIKHSSLRVALSIWRTSITSQVNEDESINQIHLFFENKRPESLLMVQKTFLLQLRDHSDSFKMCSTSLTKYAFEKWRAALSILR